ERAVLDHALERPVRRGDEAHIDRARPVLAQAADRPVLERAEQLRLGGQGEVADLVEEERAAAGRLEEALAVAVGAGERAPGVAEQLALHQLRRERAAVEGDEAAVP